MAFAVTIADGYRYNPLSPAPSNDFTEPPDPVTPHTTAHMHLLVDATPDIRWVGAYLGMDVAAGSRFVVTTQIPIAAQMMLIGTITAFGT